MFRNCDHCEVLGLSHARANGQMISAFGKGGFDEDQVVGPDLSFGGKPCYCADATLKADGKWTM